MADIRLMGDDADDVRVWLDGVRDAGAQIRLLCAEIEALDDVRKRITSTISAVGGSGGSVSDRRQDATDKLVDDMRALEGAVEAYRAQREEAREMIGRIGAPKQREVLLRRYVCGERFGRIAEALDMSIRQVFKAHARGVQALIRIRAEADR